MARDIKNILKQMTLEEKAGLCSGLDFWHTKGIERLGIPPLLVTDGPHGLRKQMPKKTDDPDHLGVFGSVPATCFPSAVGLASSWDRELIGKVGVALGEECQAEDVSVLLGPGANIKRSPLCGRNFEYFSEDPFLSSEIAAAHISGVQSQGVGTSLKHFAANNQEYRRMSGNSVVDERTLREIYLASFEGAVKKAQPWTVMSAYNQVNGTFASENPALLTDILKDEWGHEGVVVSDWGAVNERVSGLEAGLELEMPSSHGVGDRKIVEAVQSGRLSEETLDRAVERLLRIIFMTVDNKKADAAYDADAHHRLAREVARECMVLLRNEDNLLPLPKSGRIAVIGALAEESRYQGGGSSHVNPTKLEKIREELAIVAGAGASITYAQGYDLASDTVDDQLVREALDAARSSDVAILFIGLPDRYESEAFDRKHLRIPDNQARLIEAIAEVQGNIAVVLSNGAPIEMPWLSKTKAVLEAYLGGQALGGAIADILFGEVSPSGKLAETFPVRVEDNPSYLNFPGEGDTVEYREGLFVGYRYYDAKKVEPLFPFGYGLSYTSFAYSDLLVDQKEITDEDTVHVSVKVRNTGARPGKEIVQLYVRDIVSTVIRPEKELKGFSKVDLQPGEEKEVIFELDKRSFAFYDVKLKDWRVETGKFAILIARSSVDIVLSDMITVQSTTVLVPTYTRNSTIGDLMANPNAWSAAKEILKNSPLPAPAEGEDGAMNDLLAAFANNLPLRSLVGMSKGAFTEEALEGWLVKLNGSQTEN
ncbi:glycoside hydrolase family 3 C-terminal domain-containing protein [Paenibacillus sp. LHD-117]|uniref:glycoside hydrolase family 3 C-terminal domain-containing protein n=1 Tax=Paenibacillus sp. LHD-117 TaxID=3071412 RepID=UPI0027E04D27|nr:glycoside hydrolase family 3 C-terminal domain-containing protein [Paenibacillus sp. LHD-117]MDQ6420187.1 glycoside hydrolase family 3 C-terminal domain-containing protein [Paenibacillus sp. LHD-117]